MSTSVHAETTCALPAAACWEKLRDLSLAAHYVPGVRAIEFTSDRREGVGTCRIAHASAGALHETVVEWNEGRGFLLRLHRGAGPPRPMREATFRYSIEPDGARTRIRLEMSYAFGLGPLGSGIERLARRPMQRNVERIAARLARFWETGRAEPADGRS